MSMMKVKRNEIYACKMLFFSISFFVGLWTVRIPDIKDQISTTYMGMSYLFVVFSIGSIITMIIAPKLIQNFSMKLLGIISGLFISFLWICIPFVSSIYEMALLSFIFGSTYGIFEIILNIQATSLEKEYNKPMMSGFHAFWSIGLLGGSLLTSLLLEYEISFFINALFFIILLFPLIILGCLTLKNQSSKEQSLMAIFFKWPYLLMVLVLLSVTAVFLEGGTDSWGSLYMKDYLLTDGFKIGLAAISFNGMMVVGRLVGDSLKIKFGIYNFLIISIILSLFGCIIILISSTIFVSIVGFCLAGFGVSSIIPICYTLGSSIKNVDQTVGITVITIAVYGVFMLAPPVLGYVASIIGIRYVYLPVLILFIISLFIANLKKVEF